MSDTPLSETPLGDAVEGSMISADSSAPIVARAGRYYRNARYLMTIGLIVMGGFFAYDGYKRYPENNKKIDQVNAAYDAARQPEDIAKYGKLQQDLGKKKTDTDIALQKVLGFALPIAAVAYLVYFLRKSRGEIRLADDTLHVPGHPPVPLSTITSVDHKLWKKKGIAAVKYDVAGTRGTITLDDFVYQQVPIDAIYDRLVTQSPSAPVPSPGTPGEG